jgi:hypothetical protein
MRKYQTVGVLHKLNAENMLLGKSDVWNEVLFRENLAFRSIQKH